MQQKDEVTLFGIEPTACDSPEICGVCVTLGVGKRRLIDIAFLSHRAGPGVRPDEEERPAHGAQQVPTRASGESRLQTFPCVTTATF